MLRMNKMMKMMGIGLCCLFSLGCSNDSFLLEQEKTEMVQEVLLESQPEEEVLQKTQKEKKEAAVDQQEEIAVHICGEVNRPGVYVFYKKARINDGIQKAGGFTKEAVQDYLNLALVLEDGMKIEVPSKAMVEEWKENEKENEAGIFYGVSMETKKQGKQGTGKIDLNNARKEELCTLPGIGESRAQSIISYREENGKFQKIEDIMKVSGIKEAAFEKIKDLIIVSE